MCRAYALPARISSPAVCRHRPRVPPHLARKLSIVLPEVWATKARQGQRAGVVQSRAGIRFNLLSGPYSRSGGSVHGTCDPVSLWWRRPSAASPRRPPSVGRWRWELRKRQPEKRQPLSRTCSVAPPRTSTHYRTASFFSERAPSPPSVVLAFLPLLQSATNATVVLRLDRRHFAASPAAR